MNDVCVMIENINAQYTHSHKLHRKVLFQNVQRTLVTNVFASELSTNHFSFVKMYVALCVVGFHMTHTHSVDHKIKPILRGIFTFVNCVSNIYL